MMHEREHTKMQLKMTVIIGITLIVCCSFSLIATVMCGREISNKKNKVEVLEVLEMKK
jgi:hypothetical protein